MLNKRTNILFDEKIFNYLAMLANKDNTSIGDLVRKAVIKIYIKGTDEKRTNAYNNALSLRKGIKKISPKEIQELINYGRKY